MESTDIDLSVGPQIFGPETTQAELFEDTVRSQLVDFLDGKNALIFSYGVTNAGKTFTIQGKPGSTIDFLVLKSL